jgi:hypothetical protein
MDRQATTERTPAPNSTYPKGGVSCSKDSFVVNQTLVFQIKFCGKSPALRVAAKRYPQNKVVHSLFWFTNLNPVDNTAIQHLVSGNKEKAIEIWDKLTDEKEVTSKNFSAFNNIGTLYLLEDSKEEIKQGITAKIKLIESENFSRFCSYGC